MDKVPGPRLAYSHDTKQIHLSQRQQQNKTKNNLIVVLPSREGKPKHQHKDLILVMK